MSIVISPHGQVFENHGNINQLLFPVEIGSFEISNDAKKHMETDHFNANHLFYFIPVEMDHFCRAHKKLIPTQASVFKAQPESRSNASQTPHINQGNELHFFFDGSYVIYLNIKDQHYALIVQKGDWLYIPADVEHWIKPTQDNYLVIVSYHSEPFDEFHSKVTYTQTQSKAFL